MRVCTAKNRVGKKVVREIFRAESMHCKWKAVLIKHGEFSKLHAQRAAAGALALRRVRATARPVRARRRARRDARDGTWSRCRRVRRSGFFRRRRGAILGPRKRIAAV